jgi:GT2 family glycosyltransferase
MSSLVIGVNYRTDDHAVRFVRSLARYSGQEVSVILVDNSERNDSGAFLQRILEANPAARYLGTPQNLGYFGGANYGLKRYLENRALPDWVIVCNVDIEFRDDDFFLGLGHFASIESLGVVAPRIWSARWKRDLNPKILQRPSKERMLFYRFVFGNFFVQTIYEMLSFAKNSMKTLLRECANEVRPDRNLSAIYAPHGSCMIFNRRYLKAAGGLEYSMFLFGEEIFVAETVKKLGLFVGHCPSLWVLDNEHASTGIIRSRKVAGYMRDATNYLVESYFN